MLTSLELYQNIMRYITPLVALFLMDFSASFDFPSLQRHNTVRTNSSDSTSIHCRVQMWHSAVLQLGVQYPSVREQFESLSSRDWATPESLAARFSLWCCFFFLQVSSLSGNSFTWADSASCRCEAVKKKIGLIGLCILCGRAKVSFYLYSVKQAVVPFDSEAALGNIPALPTQTCQKNHPPLHFLLLPLKNHSSAPHPPRPPRLPLLPSLGWEVAAGNTGGWEGI